MDKNIYIRKIIDSCNKNNYTLVETVNYIGSRETKVYIKCNICNCSRYISYNSLVGSKSKVGCPKCSNKYKPTQEESEIIVLNKCKENNHTLMKDFMYIGGSDTRLYLKCNTCSLNWNVNYNKYILCMRKCPRCSKRYSPTQEESEKTVLTTCKDNDHILTKEFKYIGVDYTRLYLKCNICNIEWNTNYNNYINKKSKCPKCKDISKGEIIITNYLKEECIYFIQEKKFDDCLYKRKLRFDFYLPDYNICIEFDGIQHFNPVEKFGGEKEFNNTIKRDNIKNNYCIKNNIKLIRISYSDMKNIKIILKSCIC